MTDTVRVRLPAEPARSYLVRVGISLESAACELAALGLGETLAVVCDETTRNLFAVRFVTALAQAGASAFVVAVPPGEASKSLEKLNFVQCSLRRGGLDRQGAVVALGGGVVGDLAGFAAGTYLRGVPFVQVPTTLLAMVDASVGGKVAVNLGEDKNACGMFHQPAGVWADTSLLAGLPDREYKSGLAEAAKTALLGDAGLVRYMLGHAAEIAARDTEALDHVVARCCAIKADIVGRDEREGGLRRVLNYGHTIGHGLESAEGYSRPHGECVAYGMRAMALLARDAGWLGRDDFHLHQELLDALGLATGPLGCDASAVLAAMGRDKKARNGRLVFIVPRAVGRVEPRSDVPDKAVLRALDKLFHPCEVC